MFCVRKASSRRYHQDGKRRRGQLDGQGVWITCVEAAIVVVVVVVILVQGVAGAIAVGVGRRSAIAARGIDGTRGAQEGARLEAKVATKQTAELAAIAGLTAGPGIVAASVGGAGAIGVAPRRANVIIAVITVLGDIALDGNHPVAAEKTRAWRDLIVTVGTGSANRRGVYGRGASIDLCMRNNIFANLPVAVDLATGTKWATEAAGGDCDEPLTEGTWNNVVYPNTGVNCEGDLCSTAEPCAVAQCLPTVESRFFEFSDYYAVDPGFDAGGRYCISSPLLIDSAPYVGPPSGSEPILERAYDGNGPDNNGQYDAGGPDIGARETGTDLCP